MRRFFESATALNGKFENLMYNLGGIASGASATFQNLYDGTFVILHNASRNAVILLESNNVAVLSQSNMGSNTYSRSGTSITITNGSDRYIYVDAVAL